MHRRRESHEKMSQEEVAHLLEQLQSEERSERTWKAMLEESHDQAEAFENLEEHLLAQPHEHNHNIRRWKFYGK